MHNSLQKYYQRLWSCLWIFLFVLILETIVNVHFSLVSSAGLAPDASIIDRLGVIFKALLRGWFWAIAAWWLVAIPISRRWRSIVTGLVLTLCILLFIIEEFLLIRYGTVFTHSIIMILAGTNPREAAEFADASFAIKDFLVPIASLIAVGIFCYGVQRIATRPSVMRLLARPYLFWLVALPPVFLAITDTIPDTYDKVISAGHAYDYTIAPMDRVIWNTLGFVQDYNRTKNSVDRIRALEVGQVTRASKYDHYTIVLVIGETLRRDYMHCYGFPLANTPRLDSLAETGRLVLFSDAVSPAPNTIESLTKVLSLQTNEDTDSKWYDYPALPSLFSQNGFWVQWTSNQESTGTIVQAINTFSMLSDAREYVNARSIDAEHQQALSFYDEDVLPALKLRGEVATPERPNLLQIVHLLGSHPVYEKRYPPTFARFAPADMPIRRGEAQDKVVASYVNSIYYNDYVVASIIGKYANEPAIVIYFADHGEVIYDDPKNPTYCDHGMTKEALSVPLMVYVSPQFDKIDPELLPRLRGYAHRPIMLDLMTHALCDLAGITTRYSDPRLHFFSDGYDETRRRIIRSFSQEIEF